jgi:hypothetical protein
VRTERTLPDLFRGLGSRRALLHDFVDGQRLTEKSLALRLARGGVGRENRVFDRREWREELADLLDLHPGIEIPHVDFEHWHGLDSQPHLEGNLHDSKPIGRGPIERSGADSRKQLESSSISACGHGGRLDCSDSPRGDAANDS